MGRSDRKLLVLALAGLAATAAHGGAYEFRWQPPTQYVDGSALDPLTDLSEYRLYCDAERTTTFPAPATRGTYTGWDEGTSHLCSMTAVDTEGDESAQSNVVIADVPITVPGEPILFDGT